MNKKVLHIIFGFTFLMMGYGVIYASNNAEANTEHVLDQRSRDLVFSESSADPQRFSSPEERREYWQKKSEQLPHKSFWTTKKEEAKQKLLELGHKIFGPNAEPAFDYVIEVIFNVPLLIVLLSLIIAFLLNVFLVAIFVLVTNLFKNTKEKYYAGLRERYEGVLTSFLFEEIEAQETVQKLGKVKTTSGRKILIDILFNYLNNLSGEYSDRILMLYLRLGLQYESIRKISSMFFHNRIQGIRELSNMYPSGAKNIIVRYIRDKNDMVRNEAQIAYVYLDEAASFDFLDNLKRPFSRWAQLNALNFVKLHEKEVPSFDQWIHSENNDVQDFCVRMINYYQQTENSHEIISMLEHANDQTRLYAYQAVRSMNLLDAKEIIKGKFGLETRRNKLEIIAALENIGDENDFDFLDRLVLGDDIEIKLAVCKVLYKMGEKGIAHLNELNANAEQDLGPCIEHIKDPRN